MVSLDGLGAAVAIGVATWVVLRDVRADDRSAKPKPERAERHEPARVPAFEPADMSMLATLAATEADEHGAVRRVGALAVLLMLTLLTAALVGTGIYRAVSAFK